MNREGAAESQRWGQLRLLLHRSRHGTCVVSLVYRDVRGMSSFDRRMDMVEIPCAPGDPASVDALEALRLAVEALVSRRGAATG